MVVLHCNPVDYSKCAFCANRECEEPDLDEKLLAYKREHPEKTWRSCSICQHSRGLRMFDERSAHPDKKVFCELMQRYLGTVEGLCGWYC